MAEQDARYLNVQDAMDWFYRGEGAANIVLAYRGSDPLLVGKVLRLKKIPLDGQHVQKSNNSWKPILGEEEQKLWESWPSVARATSLESLIQAYARDVMSPLLGPEYVDPGILLHVSGEFLEKVTCNVHHARPCSRITATKIDTTSSSALLISDHSVFWPLAGADQDKYLLPSISVEIKPKCGFLPNSDFIVTGNDIKKRVPRFTMHQVLKLTERQVKLLSQYSPLDLFSGDLNRINEAVDSLFQIPQNNLRVFVGGSIIDAVFCDSSPDCANWQALNEALQSCIFSENKVEPVELLKELVAQSLYETNALRNLLAAQKLDSLDIEGAIHAYEKVSYSKCMDNLKETTLDIDDGPSLKSVDLVDGMSLSECRQVVRNYLIAATAKDCSLMLTFQQVPNFKAEDAEVEHYKLISSSKSRYPFVFKINFVDLDLKPLNKMLHYYHIDQKIVKTYLATIQSGGDDKAHSLAPLN
ncbi:hypothetical protein GOP47_0005093 [Adiantum capillus-veneris]|uniref:Inositol-pentakisphosphate 2-kinase n=1 Tax=Adiantum capillus-veneris TaxID=13818 RepID=A0A9D4ZL94_ADICA|nr:hypothetical protein GOP47_0005093 [Adiantum capillus-veneris]